ncbi:hypothetical protein RvY_05150-2 [Ramazzottius varieornatus]|uniref:3'-5' exonuclease domain-containing protein n=1 Tax=Ramazzottius varieornatus TaxID=947166 RepID=A0A1D1UX48_RAMVA|nr:hypothetical protein RvY_05150-2 [Ramazzottius varieornatus]
MARVMDTNDGNGDFSMLKDNGKKKRVFLCNRMDEAELGQVYKVINRQSTIGLALTFDLKNLEAGLQNLTYIIVSTLDPSHMTYVFDCVSLDPIEILADLKTVLTNPHITKVVNDLYNSMYYLYHRHYLEVQDVMDIQISHRSLVQKREKGTESTQAQPSLDDMIRLYVDWKFAWPIKSKKKLNPVDLWSNPDPLCEVQIADAALQGMYLLDIFQAQQQMILANTVQRLGPEARGKLKDLSNKLADVSTSAKVPG